MKLGTFVFLGTTGLLSVCLAGVGTEGCSSGGNGGSSSSGGSSSGGTSTNGCDDGGACIEPPPVPDAGATTLTTPQNFALHHLHVGEEAAYPWQGLGFNLDGKDTNAKSTDVCTLGANASTKNQIDGNGGIDNSFAQNIIIGLLSSVLADPSTTIDTSLAKGTFTVLMDVTGMSGTAGQSATGLSGFILAAVPFNQTPNSTTAAPTFTLADNWPVNANTLKNPPTPPSTTIVTPIQSTVTFSGAYMNNGVFVSGAPTDVTLTLTLDGVPLEIPIQHATITFNNPGDGGVHNISGGIIGGVIDANQLVMNLQSVAGNIEPALCSGATFAQLSQQILAAADIMDDGSNNPGTPCNGISIGVGFDADEIAQPTVTGTPATGTNPCIDAGPTEDSGTGAVDSGTGAVDSGSPQDAAGE